MGEKVTVCSGAVVFAGANEDVGRRIRISIFIGDHPALWFIVIFEEKGRDRAEDQMSRAEGAQMRVERAEGETHHEPACGLGVYLFKQRVRCEVWLGANPVQLHELGFPPGGVHEFNKWTKAALGARHWRNHG